MSQSNALNARAPGDPEDEPEPEAALSRRTMLGAFALCALAAVPFLHKGTRSDDRPVDPASAADWARFKRRFMSPEGRVLSTGDGSVSHSPGQGLALVAAACFNDAVGFACAESWTRRNLRRPNDHLHASIFKPNGDGAASDSNSATDGDLLIALGLSMGEQRWGGKEHGRAAAAIARDLLALVVRRVGQRTVLLPGTASTSFRAEAIISPSSYIFPALRRMARMVPDPAWQAVIDDGLALTDQARFGAWRLPCDRVAVPADGSAVRPAATCAPRFADEAMRLPLYLAWDGLPHAPAVRAASRFWATVPGPPAWADVFSNEVAPVGADSGAEAVRRFVAGRASASGRIDLPPITAASTYDSAALILLTRVAMAA